MVVADTNRVAQNKIIPFKLGTSMTRLFKAKPFVIAEIGSNWTSFDEAKDSISAAKMAGADAVKFQVFDYEALFGLDRRTDPMENQLPLEWLPKLKEKADACGIEFMCSAFSPELYDVVNPYVLIHKIASSEITYPQILNKVKSFGKPILLSVGASSKGDIELAMKILRGGPQVVLMYCSSAYPSTMYNLFQMDNLKETFHVPVGFSDHSSDVVYPPLSAFTHFQAVAIEKHVTFNDKKSPDSEHSLTGEDFRFMCDYLRGKRDPKAFNPQPEEQEMFLLHNRRLIATKDIAIGEPFRYGLNFGCYRSLENDNKGIIGHAWEVVVKSSGAKRALRAGEGIGHGDF